MPAGLNGPSFKHESGEHRADSYRTSAESLWLAIRDEGDYDKTIDIIETALHAAGQPEQLREVLRELQMLSGAATSGTWKYSQWKGKGQQYRRHGVGNEKGSGQILTGKLYGTQSQSAHDWRFIAACVNYVRAALAAAPSSTEVKEKS
jgi:hypothetical protein